MPREGRIGGQSSPSSQLGWLQILGVPGQIAVVFFQSGGRSGKTKGDFSLLNIEFLPRLAYFLATLTWYKLSYEHFMASEEYTSLTTCMEIHAVCIKSIIYFNFDIRMEKYLYFQSFGH